MKLPKFSRQHTSPPISNTTGETRKKIVRDPVVEHKQRMDDYHEDKLYYKEAKADYNKLTTSSPPAPEERIQAAKAEKESTYADAKYSYNKLNRYEDRHTELRTDGESRGIFKKGKAPTPYIEQGSKGRLDPSIAETYPMRQSGAPDTSSSQIPPMRQTGVSEPSTSQFPPMRQSESESLYPKPLSISKGSTSTGGPSNGSMQNAGSRPSQMNTTSDPAEGGDKLNSNPSESPKTQQYWPQHNMYVPHGVEISHGTLNEFPARPVTPRTETYNNMLDDHREKKTTYYNAAGGEGTGRSDRKNAKQEYIQSGRKIDEYVKQNPHVVNPE